MIEGGFPTRRVVLVVGGPGAGKTIFSIQYLISGAISAGEKVLYVSLEEKKDDLYREMRRFGWDLGKLESEEVGCVGVRSALPCMAVETDALGSMYTNELRTGGKGTLLGSLGPN